MPASVPATGRSSCLQAAASGVTRRRGRGHACRRWTCRRTARHGLLELVPGRGLAEDARCVLVDADAGRVSARGGHLVGLADARLVVVVGGERALPGQLVEHRRVRAADHLRVAPRSSSMITTTCAYAGGGATPASAHGSGIRAALAGFGRRQAGAQDRDHRGDQPAIPRADAHTTPPGYRRSSSRLLFETPVPADGRLPRGAARRTGTSNTAGCRPGVTPIRCWSDGRASG